MNVLSLRKYHIACFFQFCLPKMTLFRTQSIFTFIYVFYYDFHMEVLTKLKTQFFSIFVLLTLQYIGTLYAFSFYACVSCPASIAWRQADGKLQSTFCAWLQILWTGNAFYFYFLLVFSVSSQYHVCKVFAYMSPTKYKRTSNHHQDANYAFITSTNVMYMLIWTSHKNHHIFSECIQAKSASCSKKGLLDLAALPSSSLLFFMSERSYMFVGSVYVLLLCWSRSHPVRLPIFPLAWLFSFALALGLKERENGNCSGRIEWICTLLLCYTYFPIQSYMHVYKNAVFLSLCCCYKSGGIIEDLLL